MVLVLLLALPAAIPTPRERAAARTSPSYGAVGALGAVSGPAARALRPAVASAAAGERAASSPRLDRAVRGLRTDPLYVDPELGWTMGAATRRALRKTLRAARVPVLVAVLPRLDEDESGGDTERVLQVLQRGVGRHAVYVTADQRGTMDLASYGVPLDLSIPFGTLRPPYDDRPAAAQEADPAPPGYATVPGRIARIVGYVGRATAGPANGLVDDLDPIEPLIGASDPPGVTGDVIAASIVGGLLGLVAAGVLLGVRRLFVASAVGGGGGGGGGGGRGGTSGNGRGGAEGAGGRGGRRRNRRPGTGKRRGRRPGARRGTGRDA